METTKLCVCTNIPKELESDNFEVGKIYRHCEGEGGSDFKGKWHMVYGVQMIPELFDGNFVPLHGILMQLFAKVGLLKEDGTPLSKTAFGKLADVHTYRGWSGRVIKHKIFHFSTHPKEILISFYPMDGNLTDQTQECYEYYRDLVDGDMTPIDDKDVQIGNSGIPITYGDIRLKWEKTILDLLVDEPVKDIFK